MGNPYIIIGNEPPSAELDDVLKVNYVYTVVFDNSQTTPIYLRDADDDDVEPETITGFRPFILLETLGCSVASQHGTDKVPLVKRPPFISDEAWSPEDDKRGGWVKKSSFGTVYNGMFIPYALTPDKLLVSNGLITEPRKALDFKDIRTGLWGWSVNTSSGQLGEDDEYPEYDMNSYAETSDNLVVVKDTKGDNYEDQRDVSYVLDLDNDAYTEFDVNGTEVNLLSGTGDKNKLGSFTLLLSDVKHTGSVHTENAENNDKQDTYGVNIQLGDEIKVTYERNSTLTVEIGTGETTSKTDVQLPSPPKATQQKPDPDMKEDTLALTFMPVFNGLLVSTGLFQGLDKAQQQLTTTLCRKRHEVDFNDFIEAFDVDDPEDVQVENEGDSLVNIGNKLTLNFVNCKGSFSYVPLFFSPRARAAYYFFAETELHSGLAHTFKENENETKYHYRLLPVWCKNQTSTSLYPIPYGANDRYPQNYEDGEPTNERPRAVTVSLKLKDTLEVVSLEGDVELVSETAEETRNVIVFEVAGTNVVSAGERVTVTGDVGSGSGEAVCEVIYSQRQTIKVEGGPGIFSARKPTKDTTLELNDPTIKAKKIRFGLNSGVQKPDEPDEVETDKEALLRFHESTYTRFPTQMFGFIVVRTEERTYDINNDVGDQLNFGGDWLDFVQSVDVTHSESGTTGSMTIDRYGLMQFVSDYDPDVLRQHIGAMNLDVVYTATKTDEEAGTTNSPKLYAVNLGDRTGESGSSNDFEALQRKIPENLASSFFDDSRGILLRGIGYGQGISDSVDANEITMPLFGLQKKLEDIKLVNAPFFDGRTLLSTLKYLADYGNITMNLENAIPDAKLPASAVLSQSLADFKLGTSVWGAMKMVADWTAHTFMLQPDGVVWWYAIDRVNGLPNTEHRHKHWYYPNTRVVSSSATPDFQQFYNFIMVLGLHANSAGLQNPLDNVNALPIVPHLVGAQLNNTNPNIAWSKMAILPLEGWWTRQQLYEEAVRYAKRAQSVYWTGATTVPGNFAFKLFDTFSNVQNRTGAVRRTNTGDVAEGEFLITSITHSLDMSTRTPTTSLQLQMIGNVTYDLRETQFTTIL